MAKEGKDLSRRQDIIHPSEMSHTDWCPKATYLRIKNLRGGGEFVKEAFGFQSLNIFQHGHEVHSKWQRWLWEMGELWGKWKCHRCDTQWFDTSPKHCPKCLSAGHAISYEEIPLNAEKELLVSGSADGGIPAQKALMEFKTVGAGTIRIEAPEILKAHTHKTVSGKSLIDYEGLWRGINRPFPAHQKQGQIYLHICKLRGYDFDTAIFVYESKFHQGVKEFSVKYRESIIARLLESADDIRRALDEGAPPPQCPKGGCKHCEPKESNGQADTSDGGVGLRRRAPDAAPARRPRPGTASQAPRRRGTTAT